MLDWGEMGVQKQLYITGKLVEGRAHSTASEKRCPGGGCLFGDARVALISYVPAIHLA